ncbi:Hypp5956 [Branchiostoma lanceolatum]|uniref:Hypp5956 protein n=1 Tax=Branchiostoma lanceolatum TaxID=7740 RepID=A0A8J9YRI4_BRALA|nr:Hypp5956 [Branchiostoma lanceolatum]
MKIPGREKVCKWCSLQKKKQAVRGRTSETTFACSVCHVRLHPKTCFDSFHQWAISQRADRGLGTTGERGLASNLGDNLSTDEDGSPNSTGYNVRHGMARHIRWSQRSISRNAQTHSTRRGKISRPRGPFSRNAQTNSTPRGPISRSRGKISRGTAPSGVSLLPSESAGKAAPR